MDCASVMYAAATDSVRPIVLLSDFFFVTLS